jgi:hypothetical protein
VFAIESVFGFYERVYGELKVIPDVSVLPAGKIQVLRCAIYLRKYLGEVRSISGTLEYPIAFKTSGYCVFEEWLAVHSKPVDRGKDGAKRVDLVHRLIPGLHLERSPPKMVPFDNPQITVPSDKEISVSFNSLDNEQVEVSGVHLTDLRFP